MKIFETEEDARKRLGLFCIPVWEHTDETVAHAIRTFREKWHSYSENSKSHNIINLIKEVIDPSVSEYLNSLPKHYLDFCPISREKCKYIDIVKTRGFHYTAEQVHYYLRKFVDLSLYTTKDILFISTQETLYSLFMYCEGNKPRKSKLAPDIYINTERKTRLCELCGNPTEFSLFIASWIQHGVIDGDEDDHEDENIDKFGKKKRPDFSQIYCLDHRPKTHDGSWNATYKQAKRSSKQFETEVLRLRRQIAHPDRYNSKSGDKLIDEYFYHYLFDSSLDPTNVAELRNLARRMVNSRLTDNKKRILVLHKQGMSNREIGIKLGEATGRILTNQAISKALGTIRDEFFL